MTTFTPTELIPIYKIRMPNEPDRFRPGDSSIEDLASSISEHGLQQPIKVATIPESDEYELIYGQRRTLACLSLGMTTIEARVVDIPEAVMAELRLVENIQREDLSPLEEGVAIRRWREQVGLTQEAAAEKLGKGLSWLKKREMLLGLQDDIMDALHEGKINPSVALELNRIDDDHARAIYLDSAIQHGTTQATVQHWVSNFEREGATPTVESLETMTENYENSRKPETIPCHTCGGRKQIGELTTIFVCYPCKQALETAT